MKEKSIIKFLVGFNIFAIFPFLCLTWGLAADSSDPIIIIPIVGLIIWALSLVIVPIVLIVFYAKKNNGAHPQNSVIVSTLPAEKRNYQAYSTLFEDGYIMSGTRSALIGSVCVLPLTVLVFFEYITDGDSAKMVLAFTIVFAVFINSFFLLWIYNEKGKYKKYVGCPEKYRHKAEVEFDLTTAGKLFCKFSIEGFYGNTLTEIRSIYYNSNKRILMCVRVGQFRPITRYMYREGINVVSIIVTDYQAEELYNLIRENGVRNIQILPFDKATQIETAVRGI